MSLECVCLFARVCVCMCLCVCVCVCWTTVTFINILNKRTNQRLCGITKNFLVFILFWYKKKGFIFYSSPNFDISWCMCFIFNSISGNEELPCVLQERCRVEPNNCILVDFEATRLNLRSDGSKWPDYQQSLLLLLFKLSAWPLVSATIPAPKTNSHARCPRSRSTSSLPGSLTFDPHTI